MKLYKTLFLAVAVTSTALFAECPQEMIQVQKSYSSGTFCIDSEAGTKMTYLSSVYSCMDRSDDKLGRAHLCTLDEWGAACVSNKGHLIGKQWDWVDIVPRSIYTGIVVAGGNGCSTDLTNEGNTASFRCCYDNEKK